MKLKSIVFTFLMSLSLSCAATTIKLTEKNTVTIRGEVTGISMMNAQNDILSKVAFLKKKEIIYLVIDSPGGSVFDGKALVNFMNVIQDIPNPIHTVALNAASMGFVILQYGDKRFVTNDAVIMSHRPAVTLSGQFNDGELESQLRMLKAYTTIIDTEISTKIGITIDEYKAKVKDEWWLVGKEAKEENAADEVVKVECSEKLRKQKVEKPIRTFFGVANVIYSACPLVPYPLRK